MQWSTLANTTSSIFPFRPSPRVMNSYAGLAVVNRSVLAPTRRWGAVVLAILLLAVSLITVKPAEAGQYPSDENGRLAFWHYNGICSSLVTIEWDGITASNYTKILDCEDGHEGVDYVGHISWSPDGSELIFVTGIDYVYTLWRVDADGGSPEQVLYNNEGSMEPLEMWTVEWGRDCKIYGGDDATAVVYDPATLEAVTYNFGFQNSQLSPDLSQIVFHNRGGKLYLVDVDQLATFDPDDVGTQLLLPPELGDVVHPMWHPSGNQIVFAQRARNGKIYSVASTGTDDIDELQVLVDTGTPRSPEYSPDGRSLAYIDTEGFDWGGRLHIGAFDGPALVNLVDVTELVPELRATTEVGDDGTENHGVGALAWEPVGFDGNCGDGRPTNGGGTNGGGTTNGGATTAALPFATPGAGGAIIGGRSVPVQVGSVVRGGVNRGVQLNGDGFGIQFEPVDPTAGRVDGAVRDTMLLLAEGEGVQARLNGFAPNSVVQMSIYSQPRLLGTFTTDSTGRLNAVASLPAGLTACQHTLQVVGTLTDGQSVEATLGVWVLANPYPFTDVSALSVHGPAVGCLQSRDVAYGFGGATFGAVRSVTPGQAVSMLTRLLGPAVSDAAALVSGSTNGTFRPGAHVTRGEAAAMLAKAYGLDPVASPFADASTTHAGAIGALAEAGVISGFADGTFRPDMPVSRGQWASLLVRADYLLG